MSVEYSNYPGPFLGQGDFQGTGRRRPVVYQYLGREETKLPSGGRGEPINHLAGTDKAILASVKRGYLRKKGLLHENGFDDAASHPGRTARSRDRARSIRLGRISEQQSLPDRAK